MRGSFPPELSFRILDWDVINARLAPSHQSVLRELPLFIPVGAIPGAGVVMPFILKPNRDSVVREAPELFLQPVIQLLCPLAFEKFFDLIASAQKLGTIAPLRVLGVSKSHLFRVTCIPSVFGHFYFGRCCLQGEGW